MPLYEFRCTQCEHVFEVMQRFSEAGTIPQCPYCQSAETQKKLSTVASFASSDGGSPSSASCGSSGGFS